MSSAGFMGSVGSSGSGQPGPVRPDPAPPAPKQPKSKKAQIDLEGVHELKADDVATTVQIWQATRGALVLMALAWVGGNVIILNISNVWYDDQ